MTRLNAQGFLLDENLSPKRRAGLGGGLVVHARDLGPNPSDLTLWAYAQANALVIVTKDADFQDRLLLSDAPPPWVVQLRCGNLRARPLRELLETCWPRVLELLAAHRLVLVYPDHLEGMD